MNVDDCWIPGQRFAVWADTSARSGAVVRLQANAEGLKALSKLLSALSAEPPGVEQGFTPPSGSLGGDASLVFAHTNRLERPPLAALYETRVEPPVSGDTILSLREHDARKDAVATALVGEGGLTPAQARDAVAQRHPLVRMTKEAAERTSEAMKRLKVGVEIFRLEP